MYAGQEHISSTYMKAGNKRKVIYIYINILNIIIVLYVCVGLHLCKYSRVPYTVQLIASARSDHRIIDTHSKLSIQ